MDIRKDIDAVCAKLQAAAGDGVLGSSDLDAIMSDLRDLADKHGPKKETEPEKKAAPAKAKSAYSPSKKSK